MSSSGLRPRFRFFGRYQSDSDAHWKILDGGSLARRPALTNSDGVAGYTGRRSAAKSPRASCAPSSALQAHWRSSLRHDATSLLVAWRQAIRPKALRKSAGCPPKCPSPRYLRNGTLLTPLAIDVTPLDIGQGNRPSHALELTTNYKQWKENVMAAKSNNRVARGACP